MRLQTKRELRTLLYLIGFLLISAFIFLTAYIYHGLMAVPSGKIVSDYTHTDTDFSDGFRIVVDPGHGGEDAGCSFDGILEKDLNLSISLKLGALLRLSGADVIMTRTEDRALFEQDRPGHHKRDDLAYRLSVANTENCLFLSIHMNSFPIPKYHGFQIFYSENNPESKIAAKKIDLSMKEYLIPKNDRQIMAAGSSVFLLDRAVVPAVLVECGFLSNPEERALLSQDVYQTKAAMSMCRGLLNYSQEKP